MEDVNLVLKISALSVLFSFVLSLGGAGFVNAEESQTSVIYQEFADSTYGVTDAGDPLDYGAAIDGNWLTAWVIPSVWQTIYINYTKPEEVLWATWRIHHTGAGCDTINGNITIPQNCLNTEDPYLKLRMRLKSWHTTSPIFQCFDGANWVTIWNGCPDGGAGEKIYEEGMYWGVNKSQDEICPDKDGDFYGVGDTTNCIHPEEDCDEEHAYISPGAAEVCNGFDDDCDTLVDEDMGTTTCGFGVCEHTIENCINGVPQVCNPFKGASEEICDGLDNDCDGIVDNRPYVPCDIPRTIVFQELADSVYGVTDAGDPLDCGRAFDCDWTTRWGVPSVWQTIYINYTKPEEVLWATWRIHHTGAGCDTINGNITIPQNCLNTEDPYLKLRMRLKSWHTTSPIFQCFDGANWVTIWNGCPDGGAGESIYEEGMYWEVNKTPEEICDDYDNDGYGVGYTLACTYPEMDCNDCNADINPQAQEVRGNGIDDDCDGLIDECLSHEHCGFCEKCVDGLCVYQTEEEDLKGECEEIYTRCDNQWTLVGQNGFCGGNGECKGNSQFMVGPGNVCFSSPEGAFEGDPNEDVHCEIWKDCLEGEKSANEYYVGYAGDGTDTCVDTDWQGRGTVWHAYEKYVITQTEHADECQLALVNEPPVTFAKLNSTRGDFAFEDDTLFGWCGGSDSDNDELVFYYKWYLDGSSYSDLSAFGGLGYTELNEQAVSVPDPNHEPTVTETLEGGYAFAVGGNPGKLIICDSDGLNCEEYVFNNGVTIDPHIVQQADGDFAIGYRDWSDLSWPKIAICNAAGGDCVENIIYQPSGGSHYHYMVQLQSGKLASVLMNSYHTGNYIVICDENGRNCRSNHFSSAAGAESPSLTQLNDGRIAVSYVTWEPIWANPQLHIALCDSECVCTEKFIQNGRCFSNDIGKLSDDHIVLAGRCGLFVCDSNAENCRQNPDVIPYNWNSMVVLPNDLIVVLNGSGYVTVCDPSLGHCHEERIIGNTIGDVGLALNSDGDVIVTFSNPGVSDGTLGIISFDFYEPGVLYSLDMIEPDQLEVGQNWIFSCMASDGIEDGEWVNNSMIIIPYCIDEDGDGYGVGITASCPYPEEDCDDTNPDVNPGATEVCDGIDNDCDGEIDNVDEDNDGINDCFSDKCLGTEYWYAEQELKPNHYDSSNWPASDAYGCSCAQVLYCKPGGDEGEFKFGCSQGTKNIWEAQSNESWALECQVDGKVVNEGISKFLFENTDGDILPDLLDGDSDGDGIPDSEDDMIEDQDPPGDPDYGIPDWHPKSKHRQ